MSEENTTTWKFYLSPTQAWEAMLFMCEQATISIDFEQFILCDDSVGQKFIEIFTKKAKEGVKIRIICDTAGSLGLLNSGIPERLREAGVEIAFFNWLTPGSIGNHSIWFFRDHQRIVIIDGKKAFTGSVCIDENTKNWRETQVSLEGPVVQEMNYSFLVMWKKAYKQRLKYPNGKKQMAENPEFGYINNIPLPRKRYLYYTFLREIKKAEKNIYLTTPYFVPDRKLKRALRNAVWRGVDVRVIVPERSDHLIVDIASRTHFESLLRNKIRIFTYTPTTIHSKTGSIDDRWASVGSFNLDSLSLHYNFEGSVISRNKIFAKEVREQFEEDMKNSKEVNLKEWRQRSLLWKILELCIWPIRRFL